MSCVVEELGVGIDNFAVNLVRPTTVVPQATSCEGNVTLGQREGFAVIESFDRCKGINVLFE